MAVQRYEMLVSKPTWYFTHFYIMNCTTYSGFTNKTENHMCMHCRPILYYSLILTLSGKAPKLMAATS